MNLNVKTELNRLDLPSNLEAAIDHTVEAAFISKISESELVDLLKEKFHKKIYLESSRQFSVPHKMFHPEAGP